MANAVPVQRSHLEAPSKLRSISTVVDIWERTLGIDEATQPALFLTWDPSSALLRDLVLNDHFRYQPDFEYLPKRTHHVVVMGSETQIGTRRLLNWCFRGVRVVTVVLMPGVQRRSLVFWWLWRAIRESLLRRSAKFGQIAWARSRLKRLSRRLKVLPTSASLNSAHSVLICIESLARGGAEKQALLRAETCVANGEMPALLVNSKPADEDRQSNIEIPIYCQPSIRDCFENPSNYEECDDGCPKMWFEIWRWVAGDICQAIVRASLSIREIRPREVITYLDWTSVTAGFAAALLGVPEVRLSFRSVNPTHFRFFRYEFLGLYKVLMGLANVTMEANSRAGIESYSSWLKVGNDKVRYQKNEVSQHSRKQTGNVSSRSKGKKTDAGYVVGWFGRLSSEKDPKLWVDAFENLHRDFPQARGLMAGTGVLESRVNADVNDRGLSTSIDRLGLVIEPDQFFLRVDALCLTSRFEGHPNVVAESAACGVPVVATDTGDVAIMAEEFPSIRVSPTRDPEAVARLLADP